MQFENNFIIEFKVLLSENSLNIILSSNNWNWIRDIIRKDILNQATLEDIKIRNDRLLMKASKDNIIISQEEQINIKAEKGKVYLRNKATKKNFQIPIEDKIYIEDIYIENNLINVSAHSPISF